MKLEYDEPLSNFASNYNLRLYTKDLPYPIDAVAAVSDFDERFHEGACGSCYEVKCMTGPLIWDYSQVVPSEHCSPRHRIPFNSSNESLNAFR